MEAVIDFAVGVQFVFARVLLNDVAVVAHRHKFAHSERRAVRHEVRVLKVAGRVTRHKKLFGRHVDCLNLARLALHADGQVVHHVERNLDPVLVHHRLRDGLALLHDLNRRVVQQQHHLRLGQAVIFFLVYFLDFLVEVFNDAHTEQQRILEEGVQQLVSVVLVLDQVIDVVRRLLGGFHILARAPGEPHILIVRREHAHQVRHNRLNRVCDFGGNDGRPALNLVAERLAQIKVERPEAVLRVLAVEVVQRVGDLAADNRPKLNVVHLVHLLCLFLGLLDRHVALHQDVAPAGVDILGLLLAHWRLIRGRHLAHNAAIHSDAAARMPAVITRCHALLLLPRAAL